MRSLILLLLGACAATPLDQTAPARDERTVIDDTRIAPALGGQPEESFRSLDVITWTGAATGAERLERPLLLFAHGIGGDPTKLEGFATSLADQGIAVAAVRFPRSSAGAGAGLAGALDLPEQPADLAFVLDALRAAVDDRDDPLFRAFDADRLILGGHSLGGATVMWWTRWSDAPPETLGTLLVAPFAPILDTYADEHGALSPEASPTLVVQGTEDPLVAPFVSEAVVASLTTPAWLVLLPGVDHASLIEGADPSLPQLATTIALTRAFVREVDGEPGALDPALDDAEADGAVVTR